MKTLYILIFIQLISFSMFAQPVSNPQDDQILPNTISYIKTTTYMSEDGSRKSTGISYIDAFGRPLQNIIFDASPSGKDIVQFFEYDEYGRQSKSWLPFTYEDDYSNFVENEKDLQSDFYQSQNIQGGDIPYSEVVYDYSPYNRVIKQSAPGDDITENYIESGYLPAGSQITYWYVNELNQLVKGDNYESNTLMKIISIDQDGKQTAVYKDNTGKTILTENISAGVKTAYVYDKYGRLRYVMSPEAIVKMTGSLYTKNDELVEQYCYYYEYNNKHQLIEKQLPGKEPIYYRYDDKYRLRLNQDGNQRENGQWTFINYDKFGRTVSTGITDITISDPIPEEIIVTSNDYLTFQYYDNYDFIDGNTDLEFKETSAFHEKFDRIHGKTTGSKIRVMDGSASVKWLTSVVYYDKYGRVIQSIAENNKGGYDMVNTEYNFAGEVLKTVHKHIVSGSSDKYLVYTYNYDQNGRLLNSFLSRNADGSDAIMVGNVEYDELGSVVTSGIHSEDGGNNFLQEIDYTYDIKGRALKINDPTSLGEDLFAMSIHYGEALSVSGVDSEQYKDGKISAIQWNTKTLNEVQTYMFEYDNRNQLTKATYLPDHKYDVNFSYDLNGNIDILKRSGEYQTTEIINGNPVTTDHFGLIDDLDYIYKGNRLDIVSDLISADLETELNNDFRDIDGGGQSEYTYDANGNMITDVNKNITEIKYNHLNQPVEVIQGTEGKRTVYTYTASGGMLSSTVYVNGNQQSVTEYNGAYVYVSDSLSYTNIPGGRIIESSQAFQYHLTDHLGNVRVTFKDSSGTAVIIQEDHYYPYGLKMSGMHYQNTTLANKFLYNGKEEQEQTGWYDYGFRQLDPALARWHVIDAMAEKYTSTSPYAYVTNNPISYIDIKGLYKGGYTGLKSLPILPYLDCGGGSDKDFIYYTSPNMSMISSHYSMSKANRNFKSYAPEVNFGFEMKLKQWSTYQNKITDSYNKAFDQKITAGTEFASTPILGFSNTNKNLSGKKRKTFGGNGSISYNWETGKYEDAAGNEVSFAKALNWALKSFPHSKLYLRERYVKSTKAEKRLTFNPGVCNRYEIMVSPKGYAYYNTIVELTDLPPFQLPGMSYVDMCMFNNKWGIDMYPEYTYENFTRGLNLYEGYGSFVPTVSNKSNFFSRLFSIFRN